MTDEQRDEIIDLLTGHPKIGHVTCAEVLNEAFIAELSEPVDESKVRRWRAKNNQAKAAA